MSAAIILTGALAAILAVTLSAYAVCAIYAVQHYQARALHRTRLECELDRVRQVAALEEIRRHRARVEADLDAVRTVQAVPEPQPTPDQLTAS